MKIRATSYSRIWSAAVVYAMLFGFLATVVNEAGIPGPVDIAMYALLGSAWIVVVTTLLRLPNRTWVMVDGGIVTWRLPAKRGATVHTTPSGRVAVADIGAVDVVAQDRPSGKKTLRGHIVVLTLRDGMPVALPIWTSAAAMSTQFTALLDTLRAAGPPELEISGTAPAPY